MFEHGMGILKRLLIGTVVLFGLVVLVSMLKLAVPLMGMIIGAVAVLTGGLALIRPIPQIGLRSRVFSGMLAFWVGGIGLLAEPRDSENELGPDAQIATQIEKPVAKTTPAPDESSVQSQSSEEATEQRRSNEAEPYDPIPDLGALTEAVEAQDVDVAPERNFSGRVASKVSVQHGQWETACRSECRTRTVVSYRTYDTAPPSLVVLEIDDDGKLLISGLDPDAQHRKFYTNRAEVELERKGVRYVPARGFFARPKGGRTLSGDYVPPSPNKLTIDGGLSVDLAYLDESHLGAELTNELLDGLKAGTVALLDFNTVSFGGFGPVRFSLIGFTRAIESRTDRASPEAEPEPARTYDPIFVVGSMLSGNKFGLRRDWLRVRENPKGEGAFVYVPEMTIAGYKRWFIWFVHGRDAIALNGPSMTASPQLPAPLDVGFKFYEGTGLEAQSVTQYGLELIFE